MTTATMRQIPALIAARKAFTGNSMHAYVIKNGIADRLFPTCGALNADERKRFDKDSSRIVYVVVSYVTPIAWVLDDGTTYKVAQKFSVTTSKHQGKIQF